MIISEMQHKLATWAESDPGRRFDRLLRLIAQRTWLADPIGKGLRRLVSSPKAQFRWRNPERNPYIARDEPRTTVTSRYRDVAMALGQG